MKLNFLFISKLIFSDEGINSNVLSDENTNQF